MYLVAELTVHDGQRLLRYAEEVRPLMEAHGGRIVAMSPRPVAIEGDWAPDVLVVHEWQSREAFQDFWDSATYAPVKRLREEACESRIVLVDDWPPSDAAG